ncbi:hypothetical protein M3N55_03680 [Roseibaca sp. V10]|uniref:Uncharacterized protein n=1 Tax=Roseinatronobacter domitianus TaxID=2940293 RepID=A0ABT0LYY9_9RHOB|nr:hypothetical protein [Roseibaca domitiana]MCL1627821.1 hypothetical protein [Roseibaca domitiana]
MNKPPETEGQNRRKTRRSWFAGMFPQILQVAGACYPPVKIGSPGVWITFVIHRLNISVLDLILSIQLKYIIIIRDPLKHAKICPVDKTVGRSVIPISTGPIYYIIPFILFFLYRSAEGIAHA